MSCFFSRGLVQQLSSNIQGLFCSQKQPFLLSCAALCRWRTVNDADWQRLGIIPLQSARTDPEEDAPSRKRRKITQAGVFLAGAAVGAGLAQHPVTAPTVAAVSSSMLTLLRELQVVLGHLAHVCMQAAPPQVQLMLQEAWRVSAAAAAAAAQGAAASWQLVAPMLQQLQQLLAGLRFGQPAPPPPQQQTFAALSRVQDALILLLRQQTA